MNSGTATSVTPTSAVESTSPSVLVNCKWRCHEHITGVQRYASEFVKALVGSGMAFDEISPEIESRWRSILWEQRTLPRLARKYDVLLCPANMAPLKLPERVRLILTIHCLRYYYHPESYSRSFTLWYRFMIPRIVTRAATVITVSHTMAEEIQGTYPQSRGKVQVVYPGVPDAFCVDGFKGDEAIGPGGYWVYVGNTSPAKNLKVVLQAMRSSHLPHRLVLLGISSQQLRTMDESFSEDRVIPLGFVNDINRVAAIFRGATGLLSPSLYESFDLPTVEAMASGCPVIASDTAVHREIGEDAPIYVDAGDASAWAGVMDELYSDEDVIFERRRVGLARALNFRWEESAATVVNIINECSP